MKLPNRKFEVKPMVRDGSTPLIIGIVGPSGSGKTLSALMVGNGVAKHFGGKMTIIDTDGNRAKAYADQFQCGHVDFEPPFGPLDYVVAIQRAVDDGATVVVVDHMTHEHSGDGGVMSKIDAWLDQQCGDNYGRRQAMNMVAHARFKPERKYLNNYLVQLGRQGVTLILIYRANDKVKPIAKEDRKSGEDSMRHVGYTPETTSAMLYEMTICLLLKPGSDGRPTTAPDTDEEKILTKVPRFFRGWNLGEQITEELGVKLAKWSMGDSGNEPPKTVAAPPASAESWQSDYDALSAEVAEAVKGTKVDPKDVIRHILSWGVARGMTDQPEKLTAKTVGSRVAQLYKEVPQDVFAEVVGFVDLMTVATDA